MTAISNIVKQQVQKGLAIDQKEQSELFSFLEKENFDVYQVNANLYISATYELLYLEDYICKSIKDQKKSDPNRRSVVFITNFDTSPWFADLTYQGSSPSVYSVMSGEGKDVFFSSLAFSFLGKTASNIYSTHTGPVYMRAFNSDVSVEKMAKLITDDLFSMRRLGRAQKVITSILPAAFCFGYSLYQQQSFLNAAINGMIGNVYLTGKSIKAPLLPSAHNISRDQKRKGDARSGK